MGRSRKFDYQAVIKRKLAEYPDGLTLDVLLERAEFDVDRSTLFRHLSRLIEQGQVQRMGNARASRYRLPGATGTAADSAPPATPPAPAPVAYAPAPSQPTPPKGPALSSENDGELRAEPDRVPVAPAEYSEAVDKAVRRVVREWKRCDHTNLQIYLSLMVKPEQLDEVTAVVEKELAGLHEGNLPRFGLTPAHLSGFIPPAGPQAPGR